MIFGSSSFNLVKMEKDVKDIYGKQHLSIMVKKSLWASHYVIWVLYSLMPWSQISMIQAVILWLIQALPSMQAWMWYDFELEQQCFALLSDTCYTSKPQPTSPFSQMWGKKMENKTNNWVFITRSIGFISCKINLLFQMQKKLFEHLPCLCTETQVRWDPEREPNHSGRSEISFSLPNHLLLTACAWTTAIWSAGLFLQNFRAFPSSLAIVISLIPLKRHFSKGLGH